MIIYYSFLERSAQLAQGWGVPLIDMFLYVYEMMEKGYVTLDNDMTETIEDLHRQLTDAQLRLKGERYSRLVLQLNLPEEGEETFAFLDTLHGVAGKYCGENSLLVVLPLLLGLAGRRRKKKKAAETADAQEEQETAAKS